MARKSKKDDKRLSDAIEVAFRPFVARQNEYRAAFREAVDRLRTSSPIAKAEGLLAFWAQRYEHWGDLEAIVYLVSRGRPPLTFSREVLSHWRDAEQNLLAEFPLRERIPGLEYPFDIFSRFWTADAHQEHTIDATMLRAVEWCKIRGFDRWWINMGKEIKENTFSGGADPFTLFNFARSDYAIRNMKETLSLALDAAETLPSHRDVPWQLSRIERGETLGCAILIASSLVFSHHRLFQGGQSSDLVSRGVDALRATFNHLEGAWPRYSAEPEKLSIGATAMAIHALSVSNVDDWEQFAVPAQNWLLSQQHEDGYWYERGSPDVVWLTVLVLDALELASGGSKLTFQLNNATTGTPVVFVAYQHRDSKWLRELQNHLGALIHAKRIEFFDDRKLLSGTTWNPEIKAKLNEAKIIVPLISSNFLGSEYIQTVELPNAIERHRTQAATVIPVLLDDCDWQSLEHHGFRLSELSFLPKDENNDLKPIRAWRPSNRASAFTQIAQRIRKCVEETSAAPIK